MSGYVGGARKSREAALYGIGIGAFIAFAVAAWVFSASMEAAAFNRATGSHVSTWDAMWAEFRVQAAPTPNP